MLKQTLIIMSAVLATGLILSGVSMADNDAKGHGLSNAQVAAGTHGMQGRCNAASHQGIPLSGPLSVCAPTPPPVIEPPPVLPPPTEPPPVLPPPTEPPPPNGF
jgi:hypothetical protein